MSALDDAFYAARDADLKDRVGKKRLAHIHGVADTCVQLARIYGVDERRARLAGLLHDWDKGYDDDGIRARAVEVGLDIDPFIVRYMPRVLHAHTAARALKRDFPEIPDDVLQAIDRHTVGAPHMSNLDMVLYIADAIEPNRVFGDVDEVRALVGVVSLEDLYFEVYRYWLATLVGQREQTLHPQTIDLWNDLVISRKARKDTRTHD